MIDEPIVFIDDSREPEPFVAAEVDPGTVVLTCANCAGTPDPSTETGVSLADDADVCADVRADPSAFPIGALLMAVGIVGLVLGFAIIRWLTRDPDESPDHWRSHRH